MDDEKTKSAERKQLVELFSTRVIEEIFPNQPWAYFPKQAFFAACLKAAIKFIQLGDRGSAKDLLIRLDLCSAPMDLYSTLLELHDQGGDRILIEFFTTDRSGGIAYQLLLGVVPKFIEEIEFSPALYFITNDIAHALELPLSQVVLEPGKRSFKKLFGVGLNKAGTTSLGYALNYLGIRCTHGPRECLRAQDSFKTRVPEPFFDAYDAFCDLPEEIGYPDRKIHFSELDALHPGSKFISTVRDYDPWIKSVQKHIERNKKKPDYRGTWINFDREEETKRYHETLTEVRDYFKERPDDLLEINIPAGEGWEKLCPFLGLSIPEVEFPWHNKKELPGV